MQTLLDHYVKVQGESISQASVFVKQRLIVTFNISHYVFFMGTSIAAKSEFENAMKCYTIFPFSSLSTPSITPPSLTLPLPSLLFPPSSPSDDPQECRDSGLAEHH